VREWVSQVSFDEYLQDRPRVFRAMFPDESRSQRLSDVNYLEFYCRAVVVSRLMDRLDSVLVQEEWRIQMLPLEFLLITVRPVVVMQLRNRGGVLELRIVRTHTPIYLVYAQIVELGHWVN
jgi:hypothetical protein